jgi:hypothetical protein
VIKQEETSSPSELSALALVVPTLGGAIIKNYDAKTKGVNQGLTAFLFEVPPWE